VIARRVRLTLVAVMGIVAGTAGFLGTAPAGAEAERPAELPSSTQHSEIFGDLFAGHAGHVEGVDH
jgi:hypothetical protein